MCLCVCLEGGVEELVLCCVSISSWHQARHYLAIQSFKRVLCCFCSYFLWSQSYDSAVYRTLSVGASIKYVLMCLYVLCRIYSGNQMFVISGSSPFWCCTKLEKWHCCEPFGNGCCYSWHASHSRVVDGQVSDHVKQSILPRYLTWEQSCSGIGCVLGAGTFLNFLQTFRFNPFTLAYVL